MPHVACDIVCCELISANVLQDGDLTLCQMCTHSEPHRRWTSSASVWTRAARWSASRRSRSRRCWQSACLAAPPRRRTSTTVRQPLLVGSFRSLVNGGSLDVKALGALTPGLLGGAPQQLHVHSLPLQLLTRTPVMTCGCKDWQRH